MAAVVATGENYVRIRNSRETRDRVRRAMAQHMFRMSQTVVSPLERHYMVLGATGKIYTVKIGSQTSCDCPDWHMHHRIGPCKHLLFVFLRVLKCDEQNDATLQHQLTDQELAAIFAGAPAVVAAALLPNAALKRAFADATGFVDDEQAAGPVGRRPFDEDDCPICLEEMRTAGRPTVWCTSQCGQSIHEECFLQWSQHQDDMTCVWCRAPWAADKPAVANPRARTFTSKFGSYVDLSGTEPTPNAAIRRAQQLHVYEDDDDDPADADYHPH